MKKALLMLLVGAMLFTDALSAYAASSEVVAIAITISHVKDIEVGGSANLAIVPGDTQVSTTAITVKNIGTGIDETIALSDTVPTGWTATYQFADTQPSAGDANWEAAADISEIIAHDVTKKLWLKLIAPAVSPDTSISVSLTISAG